MIRQPKKQAFRSGLLPAFVFSLAVLALFLLFFAPYFETGDDPTFIRMVDGAKGSTDPHLVYQNILLGFLYRAFYSLYTGLPWYSLFQYALILAALTAICYGIRRLFPGMTGWIWSFFLSLFLGWECYVRIQYTKTAGAAACAGAFLILLAAASPEEKKKRIDPLIPTGILLAFAGCLMRFQQALVCILLMSGGGVFLLLSAGTLSERVSVIRKALISFGILFLLAGGCHLADRASYSGGSLEGFLEFDRARIDLLDYELPDFDENKEALEAMGINKSAYYLLKGWAYADPEVFTTETLRAMAAMRPKKSLINGSQIRSFLSEVPSGMLARRFFYLAAAGLVFWILLGSHKKAGVLTLVYEFLLFGALYYYLFHTGRYLVNRVDVPLLLAVLLILLMICCGRDPESGGLIWPGRFPWTREGHIESIGTTNVQLSDTADIEDSQNIYSDASGKRLLPPAVTAVIGIVFTAVMLITQGSSFEPLLRGSTRAATLKQYSERARTLIGEAAADPDHLYLAKLYTLSDDYAYGVFETAPEGCLSNVLWLGGWSTYTVCYQNIMAKYGITNPMKDMIDNPSVYLIDNKLKRTLKYLKTHYEPGVKAETVGSIGSFDVYSVTAK